MTNYEINQVEQEIKDENAYYCAINRSRDPWLVYKFCILLFIGTLLAIPRFASSVEFLCPHCEEEIELVVQMTVHDKGWGFPDTWTCSSCGYENYEGISYCAICGGNK